MPSRKEHVSSRLLRIARVSVEIAEAKKTSHNMLNVQKVVGLEISKQKRAPPIGEPKAAETPAAAPALAAMYSSNPVKHPVV